MKRFSSSSILRLCVLLLGILCALPAGVGTADYGGYTITVEGSRTTIIQYEPRIYYKTPSFAVGPEETVMLHQPGPDAIAVIRVMGGDFSPLLGRIVSNGRLFVINPNGVLIGTGAEIESAGLVASVLEMGEADFFAGRFNLTLPALPGHDWSGSPVRNHGTVFINEGGFALLVAPQVTNTGYIESDLGTAALICGSRVSLTLDGEGPPGFALEEAAQEPLCQNSGLMRADGGRVGLSARAAADPVRTTIRNEGLLKAPSITGQEGRALLDAGPYGSIQFAGFIDAARLDVVARASTSAGSGGDLITPLVPVTGGAARVSPVDFSGNGIVDVITLDTAGAADLTEGSTCTLDAADLFSRAHLTSGSWVQVAGPTVTLGNPASASPTFVVPPVSAGGGALGFEYRGQGVAGRSLTYAVALAIADNGVSGFPEDAVFFRDATGAGMAVRLGSGTLTRLTAVDPQTVTPGPLLFDMPLGLVEMEIRTVHVGDAVAVTLFLPTAAPEGSRWFAFTDEGGFTDLRGHFLFEAGHGRVVLDLVDGGAGDADGTANGVIRISSGLGRSNVPGDRNGDGRVDPLDSLMGGAVQGRDPGFAKEANALVTTLAGSAGQSGTTNGAGGAARFGTVFGIATDGTNLYVLDQAYGTLRRIVIATGQVTTLAAGFHNPAGLTTDGTSLYVADAFNQTIRRIVIATGEVTTLAGTAGESGSTDGTGTAARFCYPFGLTTDGTNLYVADTGNQTIRRIAIDSAEVTTLAGSAGAIGPADGTGPDARFHGPYGITTDGTHLYVTDNGNRTIRRIAIATGEVTTLAGSADGGEPAPPFQNLDGVGSTAIFVAPAGITTDGANLYVTEREYVVTIRKIAIATGEVTTLAGGSTGSADGIGPQARFEDPCGITTDGESLFVTDYWNYTIRRVEATIKGDANHDGSVEILDAILVLRALSGGGSPLLVHWGADADGDGRLGIADAVHVLQKAAGLRPGP